MIEFEIPAVSLRLVDWDIVFIQAREPDRVYGSVVFDQPAAMAFFLACVNVTDEEPAV